MKDQCTACNVECSAEDTVVCCEGFCEEFCYFHAKCVGLSYDEGCACLHQNIFWMCDNCRDIIEKGRYREAIKEGENFAKKEELNSLKNELDNISRTVSQIENLLTEPRDTSKMSECIEATNSSPLSSTKLNAIDESRCPSTDENLQLYVSNIANDVPEDEGKLMVCESIGATYVLGIKRLVAYGTDITALDYVSYKITVDARFRSTAMNRSCWPDEVRCREFKCTSRTTWRPSTTRHSI